MAATVTPLAEQGSFAVAGENTMTPYPCNPCSPTIPVETSGYVSGVDGSLNPFTITWGGTQAGVVTPSPQLNFTLAQSCAGQDVPAITDLYGIVYVYSAQLVYLGKEQPVDLQVQLGTNAQLTTPDGAPINTMTFTALVGSTPILSFFAGDLAGFFSFLPLGDNLCSQAAAPMPYSVDGTMVSID